MAMNRTLPRDIARAPLTARPIARPIVLALAIAGGLLAAATAALWLRYGTAVFVETIAAGLNACF
jgi:hypothetical protein